MGFQPAQGLIGQIDETLAITDLSDVTAVTGTGTTVVFSASPTFTGTLNAAGITATGVFLGSDGSAAAPTYSFSAAGADDWGMFRDANNGVGFSVNATEAFAVGSGGALLGSDNYLAWGNGALSSGPVFDLFLYREAAATLQMGADVNGAAVAQTFKAHDGVTGTDIAGANLILAGGRGTGAGAVGNLIFQTSTLLGSGTTAQTLATRLTIDSLAITSTLPLIGSASIDVGSSAIPWRTGYFGTALVVGTNPAATGIGRFQNNTYLYWRNAANGADVLCIGVDGSDRIIIGNSATGVYIQSSSSGAVGFFSTTPVTAKTGWGTATGTATRTTFATTTVTLEQLAERVKALIDDLHQTAGYGLLRT
jgi:hypothetical protein